MNVGAVEPLAGESVSKCLAQMSLLSNLGAEFPDAVFGPEVSRVVALSADDLRDLVLPQLVEAVATEHAGSVYLLDLLGVREGTSVQGTVAPPTSFVTGAGATAEDVLAVLRGEDPRFVVDSWLFVAVGDYLVVAPWCEIRVIMPDLAFVAARPGASPTLDDLLAPYAWTLDELLGELGMTFYEAKGRRPTLHDLIASVPESLRRHVEANYGPLLGASSL